MYLLATDIICLITFLLIPFSYGQSRLISTFHSKTPISNVEIANNTIYIGAENFLYSLNAENLTLIQSVSTGPVLDSHLCNSELSSCIGSRARQSIVETNNYNKILHRLPGSLLTCGSVRQGVCELRSLDNISRVIKNSTVAVAANSKNASTISLIDNKNEKLYVAATYSYDSPYREGFPAVTTRLLYNFLPINAGSLDGEAAVHIRAEYRSRFRVNYIHAFRDEHYIYWATVQNKNAVSTTYSKKVTKLIRVCQDDDKYVSYSEIEIQCRSEDNANFNILKSMTEVDGHLVGIFTDDEGKRGSAICFFQLEKIRLTFWYNIDRCRGGTDTIGLPHIGRDSKCINKSHLPLSEDTCQLGVGGTIEVTQFAAIQFKERLLTAIDARIVLKKTLVIAGTNGGEIIQMSLNGASVQKLEKYNEFVVGADAVSKVIFANDDKFYVVVGNELVTLRVSVCHQHTSCSSCIESHDPFCGWCMHEGKCSAQSECQSGLLLTQKCPQASGSIHPLNHSVNSVQDASVFVPILNLPAPVDGNKNYECYFGAFKSKGHWSSKGVKCRLPEQRPTVSAPNDYIIVPLSVRSSLSRINIVQHNFTFFDCNLYKICSTCSQSKWSCQWCGEGEQKCKSDNDKCSNVILSDQCPKINIESQPEVLIADNTNATVSFNVLNMIQSDSDSLQCRFSATSENNKEVRVPAKMQNNKISCASAKFTYNDALAFKNYSLELVKHNEVIDTTQVTVYKCEEMASDCSQCLSLDPKWRCTWCKSGCHFDEVCGPLKSQTPRADTLCNEPVILSFSPKGGPIEGGTKVEITGRDLGSRIQDVTDRIMVAGSKCNVVDYEISVKIVCVVEKGTGSGPIRITVGKTGKRYVESAEHFSFKDIAPKSIYPSFGPISGGTALSLRGINLDIGSNVSVHLDNLPCKVVENKGGDIKCLTSPSRRIYDISAIRLEIDKAVRVFNARFSYRSDPIITSISPTASFASGGRIIVVNGENFDSVMSAKMFLLSSAESPVEIVSNLGECQISNSTKMLCTSPAVNLPANHHNIDLSSYTRWPVGFIMDDVKEVRNLGYRVQMTTVPDPQFTPFEGIKIQSPEQLLIIRGNFLAQAATLDEYTVSIGTERCPVVVLEAHELLCRLPSRQPDATDDDGKSLDGDQPMVVVRVGAVRAEIGLIEYDDKSALLRMNLERLLILGGSGLIILAAASFLIIILWRRRSNKHERDYKRIQMQMEQMETSVRNECKQAFAELQTDMTDLTMAIEDGGIPYNERVEFVYRLLFRDSSDSSVLSGWNSPGQMGIYTSQMPIAMGQFDSLMWNRQFLFIFVQMTEMDHSITVSEKSTLASLLIAALSRNMSFCTDIVLSLLSTHIENMIQGKRNIPLHLLFRQSDSLIEKLFQHWLTICLYPYLCDQMGPGRYFYLLYKALKCQTEKGPVDAITGNARYSLSEQKLLRECVDSQAINLQIIPFDGFPQTPINCRVLQCDTISQVKAKFLDLLYKNVPYSDASRLTIDQFDLEWACPRKGSILLLDDDKPQNKGIKRLNTIGYYNLPNNSLIAMQTRNQQSFTYRSGSSNTTCSAWSSTHLIESPTSNGDVQYYHLCPPMSSSGYGSLGRPYSSMQKKKKNGFKSQAVTMPRNIPEVYLTRLLTCKGTIQNFVTDFFDSIMITHSYDRVPVVLKYVLDFLDREAERNGVVDQDIIHAWKTNAIVLRFWMQLIHNPDCLFDIQRQHCLDASLVVIGQTLMDAFSQSDYPLGKESPSSKLLFAKDIARYRPIANNMFLRLKNEPPVDDKLFYEHITAISKIQNDGMSGSFAVNELLHWVKANGLKLVDMLAHDPVAVHHRLAERLEQIVHCTLADQEHIYATLQ